MIQAEECIIEHPDSALAYLSSLEKEIKDEPKETQMYYYLLTIKAKDKLYIYHTSDSLIKVITQFYEDYGNNDKLMEAYYYMGSVYRDMNDAPRALKAFQDAIDVGKDSKRYDLLAQTYGQMATLFAYQELYEESLIACKQSLKYHSLLKNYSKIAVAIRNIARMYYSQKEQDSALIYYQKAYSYALESKDNNRINSLLSELGCFFYDIGKKDSAKSLLIKAIDKGYDIENAIFNLGIIYLDAQQLDSAQYYLSQSTNFKDIYKQQYAYTYLSKIEKEKRNYLKALDYAYTAQKLRDSSEVITQTEAINKIQSLYNYQHTEKENNQLRLDNESRKAQIYRLLFTLMLFTLISLFTIIYIRKRKQKSIEQEKILRLLKEKQYAQSLEHIEDNKKKIYKLEQQLHEAAENDILNKQIIQSQKEQLEHINSQVFAVRNEQDLLEKTFKQSPIYLLFHKIGNDETIKITEKEWATLQQEIDKTYQNFTDRLYALYPQLSLLELRICYLIKISMPVRDIAQLLNRSKSAISIGRTRLYKKIHGTEGTVEMMDQFIANL
ncbi:tetratricopeptide repeat protein [Phocaeicola sp.]